MMGILLNFLRSEIADAITSAENDITEGSTVDLNCQRSCV
jgi:hypothetical protein